MAHPKKLPALKYLAFCQSISGSQCSIRQRPGEYPIQLHRPNGAVCPARYNPSGLAPGANSRLPDTERTTDLRIGEASQ